MRKTSLTKTALAVLMLAAFIAGPAFGAAAKAKITTMKGDVKIKTSASASWEAAKKGESISEGAAVKCGADSEAFIAWGKGHVLKIGPVSSITLSSLSEDKEVSTSKVSLDSGKVFAKAGKLSKGSTFEVKTPTAVAGVRGTGFEATPNSFAVVEGTVAVSAGGQEIEVGAGMMTEIPGVGEPPAEPAPIPPDMLNDLKVTFEATVQVSTEAAAGEGTSAAPAATPAAETPAEVENVANTIDSTVDNTTIQNAIVEQATSDQFLPGTGGLQGTIDIQYGN